MLTNLLRMIPENRETASCFGPETAGYARLPTRVVQKSAQTRQRGPLRHHRVPSGGQVDLLKAASLKGGGKPPRSLQMKTPRVLQLGKPLACVGCEASDLWAGWETSQFRRVGLVDSGKESSKSTSEEA